MALNRALVWGAGTVIGALGDQAGKVLTQSPDCRQAIGLQMSNTVIAQYCGPAFGNGDLIMIVIIGGIAIVGLEKVLHVGEAIKRGLERPPGSENR